MQAKELRELSEQELSMKLHELKEAGFHLRLRRGTNRLDNATHLKNNRRDIARALTVLRERTKGTTRS